MASRTFATQEDYVRFAEEPFEGSADTLLKRLRSASVEVEKLTRLARYDADEDGYPTDADISEAFTEAACSIVEHWEVTGDPTGAIAAEGAVKIGSVSLGTTSSNQAAQSQRDRLVGRIGEKAVDILGNAGLLSSVVSHL